MIIGVLFFILDLIFIIGMYKCGYAEGYREGCLKTLELLERMER